MESILVYYFHCQHYILLGWAVMKFSAGTLTTHRVDRLVTAIRENVCMPPYIPLELNFSQVCEDVRNVHASYSLMSFILHYSLPYKLLILLVMLTLKDNLSCQSSNCDADGRTRVPCWQQQLSEPLWHSLYPVEGVELSGGTQSHLTTTGGKLSPQVPCRDTMWIWRYLGMKEGQYGVVG